MAVTLRNNVAINGGLHVDTWSPQLLFPAGTQDVWYDPGDIDLTWRKNIARNTETFSDWSKTNVAVTQSAIPAPNGTSFAYKLIASYAGGASVSHRILAAYNNYSVNHAYTFSVYMKAAEYSVGILDEGTAAGTTVSYDLITGVATKGTPANTEILDYGMINVGNGWWRCWVTIRRNTTIFRPTIYPNTGTFIGNDASGIYIWGAQVEYGTAPTSYQSITDGVNDYYQYKSMPIMYQDYNGSLPTAEVEQPVGLILDKSSGLTLGPELATVAPTLSANTTYVNNVVNLPATVGDSAAFPLSSFTQNRTYEVTYTVLQIISSGSSSTTRIGINGNAGLYATIYNSSVGTFKVKFIATNGNLPSVYFLQSDTGTGQTRITNISVREVPGIPATQSTPNSRPYLRARHNRLTYSEQFDNAAWTKDTLLGFGSGSVANATTAPDGTNTADKIVLSTTAGQQRVYSDANPAPVGTYTYSVYAKPAGYNFVGITIYDGVSYKGGAVFNISTGEILSSPTPAGTPTIVAVGNGWYRVSVTCTTAGNAANGFTAIRPFPSAPAAVNGATAGNGTDGIYIWGADLRTGTSPGIYQRTTASTYSTTGTLDYDPVGQKPYLWFDGTDDSLLTSSINFSGTNKMFVCAGVTKLSDATAQIISELSASSSTGNNGSFAFISALSPSNYAFYLYGTSLASRTATTYTAPTTDVLSASYDISATSVATEIVPRIDGLTPTLADAGDAGTGNFGNYPLYIGRRNNATLPFNGLLYNLMIIGTQVDPVNIGKAERFVADRTGITI